MDGDQRAFEAELGLRLPDLAAELLGRPSFRTGSERRWGRRGSLSLVVAGEKAGQWYDHERGEGGGFRDLVARELGLDRDRAHAWIADRIGRGSWSRTTSKPRRPSPRPEPAAAPQPAADDRTLRAERARQSAEAVWREATPASDDHPYLRRKGVSAHGLRADGTGALVAPLHDLDGALCTLEFIQPDGAKRYLAGGAKRGHFHLLGGPLADDRPILICEGWATGASLHEATGLAVAAAMDAGNLRPVAEAIRARFPQAAITLVADNDVKPDRDANPGVVAARKAAEAVGARLAIPSIPGDANDLAAAEGPAAVAACVAAAAFAPEAPPTYPAPTLSVEAARTALAEALRAIMADVPAYWRAVEERAEGAPADPLDFNLTGVLPPLLGLPVDVGLGKSSAARRAIALLLASGGLGVRKVVYAVPRHDLGAEQVAAFEALGVRAMLWKGRGAPDPTPEEPERLMCLDQLTTFDALEVERPVEQSCCSLRRGGELHRCPRYEACGYQRQKPVAKAAQVVVCAHDSLFHVMPEAIREVGLLVIDEGFWRAGLRGLDGKAVITQDGLEPGRASVTCYKGGRTVDPEATADLIDARLKLWKALQAARLGPLAVGLLRAAGLTPEDCRQAATLERRRWRDPGLLPGMSEAERRKRIETVLPPFGEPWAPPGRCAALWLILAEALENGCDAAGAALVNEMTESGTVRAMRLRWRTPLRGG